MLLAVPTTGFANESPALVDSTVVNKGVVIGPGQVFSSFVNVLTGSFRLDLTTRGTSPNSVGSVMASLIDAAENKVASIAANVSGKGEISSSSEPFSLAAGIYRIMWTGTSTGNGAIHADAELFAQGGQTVAVPGPEAGAGLGALAMAGLAYAVSRRRKLRVAA
ncbi:hypothetical protein FVA81_01705 (plasmid) [Rhizobium sp. WL3]|uniref:hypothetical protein n=1 Tax=Rhizobium sp. WL3 TaxID=2603277 RepID=UPI0011C1DBF3|nr:hypothetical protein [Rhizobium sp. WL3]QEE43390.1 hypothetical protein FVA81_01705 [Rhizobium sp. WL3]